MCSEVGDPSEVERVRLKENAFYSIWHDTEPNIKVLEFPNITEALIEKYRRKAPNFNIDNDQFAKRILSYATKIGDVTREPQEPIGARVPDDITLRDYQEDAIAAWVGRIIEVFLIWLLVQEKRLPVLGLFRKYQKI